MSEEERPTWETSLGDTVKGEVQTSAKGAKMGAVRASDRWPPSRDPRPGLQGLGGGRGALVKGQLGRAAGAAPKCPVPRGENDDKASAGRGPGGQPSPPAAEASAPTDGLARGPAVVEPVSPDAPASDRDRRSHSGGGLSSAGSGPVARGTSPSVRPSGPPAPAPAVGGRPHAPQAEAGCAGHGRPRPTPSLPAPAATPQGPEARGSEPEPRKLGEEEGCEPGTPFLTGAPSAARAAGRAAAG